jgi:hypothetical protein
MRLIRVGPALCGIYGSLVEVHVTIDETRQQQIVADIEDLHAVRQGRRGILANGCDSPPAIPISTRRPSTRRQRVKSASTPMDRSLLDPFADNARRSS